MTGEDLRNAMYNDRFYQQLKSLTYRERKIIMMRYGMSDYNGDWYTQEQVGRIFMVTAARISQIEAKAIRKLQHPVRAYKLKAHGLLGMYALLTLSKRIAELARKIAIGTPVLTSAERSVWWD